MREIDRAHDAESALAYHSVEDLLAPLATAIGRQHGIQRHGAVEMKADPVIGKYGVRLHRLRRIGGDQHFHAGPLERLRQGVELRQGEALRFGGIGRSRRLLEGVARGGLRIEAKARRPHHEHGPGALRLWARIRGAGMARHYNTSL